MYTNQYFYSKTTFCLFVPYEMPKPPKRTIQEIPLDFIITNPMIFIPLANLYYYLSHCFLQKGVMGTLRHSRYSSVLAILLPPLFRPTNSKLKGGGQALCNFLLNLSLTVTLFSQSFLHCACLILKLVCKLLL